MPSFPVTSAAVQVSQSITLDALIQNTGTKTLYLSNESAVSISSYGMRVTPGGTVNWPKNRDLWAVCAPGESSTLSVLYNAGGASLAEVNAQITGGTIDIGEPVLVQGGGELLGLGTTNVPNTGGTTVIIPAPASGLTYPALRFRISNQTPSVNPNDVLGFAVYSDNGSVFYGSLAHPNRSLNPNVDMVGSANEHSFTVPFDGNYPVRIVFTNGSSVAITADWAVWGVASAVTEPTTDISLAFLNDNSGSIARNPAGGETTYLFLPPSFQSYTYAIYVNNSSAGVATGNASQVNVDRYIAAGWSSIDLNIQANPYTGVVELAVQGKAKWGFPGLGQAVRVTRTASNNFTNTVTFWPSLTALS